MRPSLTLALVVASIAVGAILRDYTGASHRALAAIGLSPDGPTSPEPSQRPALPDNDGHPSAGKSEAGESHKEAKEIHMTAAQIAAQDITVAPVGAGTLTRHLVVPGTVTADADRIARVPARVVGTVTELRKRLGDTVQKGEVVAVLDSREVADAKSEYLTTLVQAELQKTNFERQQKLLSSQATSVLTFDQARASHLECQLRVDLARQKLSALGLNAAEVQTAAKKDETTPNQSRLRLFPLRAPISGRIVERKVDIGTKVGGEGDPADIYTITDLSSVWLELAVPTADLGAIREGGRVTVATGAADGASKAEGQVIFVSPLLNAETRSARVIVALPNPDQRWRPGTFVMAEVAIAEEPVPVRVTRAAVQTIGGERVVFVQTDEGFERREVDLGRADDDGFEVTSGLTAGEEIAVTNTFLLKAELGKAATGDDD